MKKLESISNHVASILILVVGTILLTACGSEANSLIGKWEVVTNDNSSTIYIPPMIESVKPGGIVEFLSDGTLIFGSNVANYKMIEQNRFSVDYRFLQTLYEFHFDNGTLVIMRSESKSPIILKRE
jgi:hypothetical protein